MTFLANAVADLPSGVPWLRTYVVGGGGVANVSTTTSIEGMVWPLSGGCSGVVGGSGQVCMGVTGTDTALALNGGAGIEFRLVAGLWVGGDVRDLHIFGDRDDSGSTRAGVRASYRF